MSRGYVKKEVYIKKVLEKFNDVQKIKERNKGNTSGSCHDKGGKVQQSSGVDVPKRKA